MAKITEHTLHLSGYKGSEKIVDDVLAAYLKWM